MSQFSKSYCLWCGREMRKWIDCVEGCVSMCINTECENCGSVEKDIKNINNFKFSVSIKICNEKK